mmetsp:Transcript_408/g.763  ORF Transcript_408/g.763 Transcript_408/m.763 type:complete len:715 (+) Transcript_408:45-2189(+)|eukprot:CAMPEP_0175137844 /NCGR_PEP_ID=MMETSP0087-20121206/10028_1 /TAXON_ID=136419 /ORGANISM="Unknown Unknown, Strain D1" /LENGTH=714 /DNA_ID=CAMNT_0016420699 /DNA_START=44 /DNA_END=2188 /DNA_ORIENTATION=+
MNTVAMITLLAALIGAEPVLFPKTTGVVKLDKDNFEARILKRKHQISVVQFYSPKSKACKEMQEEYVKVAEGLRALAVVGGINCLENRDFCKSHGVKTMPHHIIFAPDKKGVVVGTNYTAAKTAKKIITTVKDKFPKMVKQYTKKKGADKKFNKANKKLPKVLYFSNKKGDSALLNAMAFQFKGRLAFAIVQKSERKITKECGVKKFPAIGVVKVGDKDKNIVMYQDSMTPGPLSMFLHKWGLDSDQPDFAEDFAEELSDESCMKFVCKSGGLCAILIQAVKSDKHAINQIKNELTILNQVEANRPDTLFSFAWINSATQADFLDKAFGISPQDYPQLVVLSATKKRFALFVGAYREDQISEYLTGVQKGKIKTVPMHSGGNFPLLSAETERCKGFKREFRSAPKPQAAVAKRGHQKLTVADITASTFDKDVMESRSFFMVAFVAGPKDCPTCEAFQEDFEKSQKDLKGIVKFGVVDCSAEENDELAKKFDVRSFPDIKVFPGGVKSEDVDTVETYEKEKTQEEMTKYAQDLLSNLEVKSIKPIDEITFPAWVREGPYHPRLILFTKKDFTPNLYKALALEYEDDDIKFAISYGANKALGAQFKISTFPKLVNVQGQPPQSEEEKQQFAKTGGISFQTRMIEPGYLKYEFLSGFLDQMAYIWPIHKEQLKKTNPEWDPKSNTGEADDEEDDVPKEDKKDRKKGSKKGNKNKREL